MSLLKYVTIVNQNGESSKSTKHKTTDHQEKIKEYEKNRTRIFFYRNGQSVGHGFEMKPTKWYVHGAKNIVTNPMKGITNF